MKATGEIAMIAAVGNQLELGCQGDLVWYIPDDLKNFKRLTMSHPVIMGRKTWESLRVRPLPGRLNIVMSRSLKPIEGASLTHCAKDAIALCSELETPFVIGGAEIYKLFMPHASTLYITHIDAKPSKEVDTWFPEYRYDWEIEQKSEWMESSDNVKYRFEKWVRK